MAAEAGLDDIVTALLIAGADPNSVHAVCYNSDLYELINIYNAEYRPQFRRRNCL